MCKRARDHQNLGNSIEQLKLVVAKMIIIAWLELVVWRLPRGERGTASPPQPPHSAARIDIELTLFFQVGSIFSRRSRILRRISWIVFFFTIKVELPRISSSGSNLTIHLLCTPIIIEHLDIELIQARVLNRQQILSCFRGRGEKKCFEVNAMFHHPFFTEK